MQRKLLYIILVSTIIFFASSGTVRANLVANPGFDDGTWTSESDWPDNWTGDTDDDYNFWCSPGACP